MSDNEVKIIVAIIGVVGTFIGGLYTYQIKQIFNELTEMKKRLDEHNHYAEKFAENSKNVAIINEKQNMMYKSVDKMQKDIEDLKLQKCKI